VFVKPVLAAGTETCTEFVGARLLAVDTALTAATGGAVVVEGAAVGATGATGVGVGETDPPTAAVGAVATVVTAGAGVGAGATVGCATTVDVTAGGANTTGVTVTERIVPASTLFDGADTRSPLTVPPFVKARRGRSIDAASITAGPLTLTVPVLPNEPFGTSAINPPVIVALPRLTLPVSEATVRPLDTVTVEKARFAAAATSADAAASEMG
jgi:hypothetical protein